MRSRVFTLLVQVDSDDGDDTDRELLLDALILELEGETVYTACQPFVAGSGKTNAHVIDTVVEAS